MTVRDWLLGDVAGFVDRVETRQVRGSGRLLPGVTTADIFGTLGDGPFGVKRALRAGEGPDSSLLVFSI